MTHEKVAAQAGRLAILCAMAGQWEPAHYLATFGALIQQGLVGPEGLERGVQEMDTARSWWIEWTGRSTCRN